MDSHLYYLFWGVLFFQPKSLTGLDVTFIGKTNVVSCDQHHFEATCPDEHVIYIHRATYTRRKGQCVDKVLGACNCDVTSSLGKRCSGRTMCRVTVLKRNFKECTCSKDYNQHLYVNNECIPVGNDGKCKPGQPVHVTLDGKEGYISSLTTKKTGSGNSSCPWLIRVQHQQQVEISIADFSAETSTLKYFQLETNDIKESTFGADEASGIRMKKIATVSGPDVQIVIFTDDQGSPNANFLIHYKVIGHPPPSIPTSISGRAEKVKERSLFLVYDCGTSGTSVNMTCNFNQWTQSLSCRCSIIQHIDGGGNIITRNFPVHIVYVLGVVTFFMAFILGAACMYIYQCKRMSCSIPKLAARPA